MIRRDTIRADFETATRAVAENLSKAGKRIDVVFRGNGAYTDGSTIVLPAGDHTKMMTAEDQAIVAGYTDHEAAHILYTDFEAYSKGHEEAKGNPLLHEMVNAIEDMRIERQMIRQWPGVKDNLAATTKAVNTELLGDLELAPEAPDMSDPREWLPVAVTWEGRVRAGLDPESNGKLIDMLGDDVKAKAKEIVDAIEGLSDGREGTSEVIDLAKRFVEETLRLPPPPDKPKDGDKETEQKGKRLKGKPDGDDEAKAEQDGEAEQEEATSEDKGEDESEDSETKAEDGKSDDIKTQPVKRVPKAVLDLAAPKGARVDVFTQPIFHDRKMEPIYAYDARTAGFHRTTDISERDALNDASGDVTFQEDIDTMRGNVATMRAKLRRALMAKKDRVWMSGQTRGRFDTRRLVPAMSGAHDVYQVRHDGEDIDTAVTILVDCSASMAGSEIMLARQTATALATALEGTGVAYEILGFTNRSTALNEAERDMLLELWPSRSETRRDGKYGLLDRVHIYQFKGFDEPLREARRAIGNIANVLLFENNDADSLFHAWKRIAKRRENRKVIIVLSDGYPSCAVYGVDSPKFLHDALKEMVQRISDDGVTLIGIGIRAAAVKHFYPKWEVVSSVTDLSGRVIDNVSKMLLGTQFVVDNSKLGEGRAA